MLAKLKIAHMGLILVCFPLICELIFVATLATLLRNAEFEIQKQRHAQNVIAGINELDRGTVDACLAAGAYKLTNAPLFKARYDYAEPMIEHGLSELTALCSDNVNQMRSIRHTKELVDAGLKVCRSLRAGTSAAPTDEPGFGAIFGPESAQFRQLRGFYKAIAATTSQLLIDEKGVVEVSSQKEVETRNQVEGVLIGGVIFNVLLALFIAYCFYRRITIRLQNVMENTQKLPAGLPLNPPVGGGDEIAELDFVFHGMATKMKEMERMKGQLIAMISHDLRTPLTSIQGMLTLLARDVYGALPDKARKNVELAENDVSRLITLSNALIDVEGMANGRLILSPADISLNTVISRSIDSLDTFAEQHGVLIKANNKAVQVWADQDRLVQVVVNLLSNAIKFSQPSMTVEICVVEEDQFARFMIKDQGRGIPTEFIGKLFQPFQQAEEADAREKSGKGLGLAICKMIIEQSGGAIGVESTYGHGSTFWFTVPVSPRPGTH